MIRRSHGQDAAVVTAEVVLEPVPRRELAAADMPGVDRPERISHQFIRSIFAVQIALEVTYSVSDTIEVTPSYFAHDKTQPNSQITYSSEEIRRAPGSGGDVSRILYGLPSVAKVNDELNSLVVRGGSPSENTFFVDNIEIPNISHFGIQGSSGGHIGLINVDFVQDVHFSSGGFSEIPSSNFLAT